VCQPCGSRVLLVLLHQQSWSLNVHRQPCLSEPIIFALYHGKTSSTVQSLIDMALDMKDLNAIDARILVLEQELAYLKKHRNNLLPLFKLPPELIVRITRIVQSDFDQATWRQQDHHLYDDTEPGGDGQWTRIMLLCRHIRNIVVDARALWRTVDFNRRAEWTQLCLERAGDTSLDIIAKFGLHSDALHNTGMSHEDFAQTYILKSRVARLHYWGEGHEAHVARVLQQPAPIMRCLYLSTHDESGPTLSSNLLGGECDNLRRLALRTLRAIESDPPRLVNLRQLELDVRWIEHRPQMDALLGLLDGTPILEELSLIRGLPRSLEDGERVQQLERAPVHLPHLRLLRMDEHIEHILLLLRLLPEPSRGLHVFVHRWSEEALSAQLADDKFADLFNRLSSFWTARTGAVELPNGHMLSARELGMSFPPMHTLRFASHPGSPTSLIFKVKCKIASDVPILGQVKTLHLSNDRTGPSLGEEDGSGAAYMTRLERIVLERPSTAKQLQSVEKFAKENARAGRPIREVEVQSPAAKLVEAGKVDAFFRRLQKAGVATTTLYINRTSAHLLV
jgi:hypothetical protein